MAYCTGSPPRQTPRFALSDTTALCLVGGGDCYREYVIPKGGMGHSPIHTQSVQKGARGRSPLHRQVSFKAEGVESVWLQTDGTVEP